MWGVDPAKGKVVECENIVLSNGEMMRIIEDEGYKYLGILEMDEIKEEAMKNRFKEEYLRRLRLILRSKLNGKVKFQAINSWAVALLRYGAGIVKWSNEELRSLDTKSRKLLIVHGAFHPRSNVDRLYLPRGKGRRRLMSCESCIRAEDNGIGWYVKNTVELLLVLVRKGGVINTEECMTKEE